jgi:hypothetical protein
MPDAVGHDLRVNPVIVALAPLPGRWADGDGMTSRARRARPRFGRPENPLVSVGIC